MVKRVVVLVFSTGFEPAVVLAMVVVVGSLSVPMLVPASASSADCC